MRDPRGPRIPAKRRIKEWFKRNWHFVFVTGQELGFDLLPRHFYSSIPDVAKLRRTHDWRQPRTMVGVAGANLEHQLAFARQCCTDECRAELARIDVYERACRANGEIGYGPVEAEFLFCFVATIRPRAVVQVGAGVSTSVILQAAQYSGIDLRLTCVDPYPTAFLKALAAEGRIELLAKRAQDIDISFYTALEPSDLLFVDSTHVVGPGSEVNLVVLEVLPRLRSGVFVHFHDIYFPYDYAASTLVELFFPVESCLLHAFLTNNSCWTIAVSLSMLHWGCPDSLRALLPRYQRARMRDGLYTERDPGGHFPTSTYLLQV
jgi:predicted O-methyltransferase YrrM